MPYGSAELYSIRICQNRREPRRFCGARLCEPQHVGSGDRVGFVKMLGGRQSSCGSQTRAPLFAVSQSCTLRCSEKFRGVGPSDALPNTIRRYSRLKICATAVIPQKAKQILGFSARGSSPQTGRRGGSLEGIDWPLGPSVAPRRISFPPLFRRLKPTAPITQSLRDISKGEIRLSSCSYRVLEGIEQL